MADQETSPGVTGKDEGAYLESMLLKSMDCITCNPRAAGTLARVCAEYIARKVYKHYRVKAIQRDNMPSSLSQQTFGDVLENLKAHLGKLEVDEREQLKTRLDQLDAVKRPGDKAAHPGTHLLANDACAAVANLRPLVCWGAAEEKMPNCKGTIGGTTFSWDPDYTARTARWSIKRPSPGEKYFVYWNWSQDQVAAAQ